MNRFSFFFIIAVILFLAGFFLYDDYQRSRNKIESDIKFIMDNSIKDATRLQVIGIPYATGGDFFKQRKSLTLTTISGTRTIILSPRHKALSPEDARLDFDITMLALMCSTEVAKKVDSLFLIRSVKADIPINYAVHYIDSDQEKSIKRGDTTMMDMPDVDKFHFICGVDDEIKFGLYTKILPSLIVRHMSLFTRPNLALTSIIVFILVVLTWIYWSRKRVGIMKRLLFEVKGSSTTINEVDSQIEKIGQRKVELQKRLNLLQDLQRQRESVIAKIAPLDQELDNLIKERDYLIRQRGAANSCIHSPFHYDSQSDRIYYFDTVLDLSGIPFRIMKILLESGKEYFPLSFIREAVWGDSEVTDEAVRQQILYLNRTLELKGYRLLGVRYKGYQLKRIENQ